VRGEFRPAPLLNDDSVVAVHPLLVSALAEGTAAAIFRERGNPQQAQLYETQAATVLVNIANQLIRSQQGTTVRLGRISRRRQQNGWNGSGFYGGY